MTLSCFSIPFLESVRCSNRSLLLSASFTILSVFGYTAIAADADPRAVFVRNDGQWAPPVQFRAGDLFSVFLEANGITWSQLETGSSVRLHDQMHIDRGMGAGLTLRGHAWHVNFTDADPHAKWTGLGEGPTYFNFLLGNDPSLWAGHVPHFRSVVNKGLWPGIDLVMRGAAGNFKYDLVLSRVTDVHKIRFSYTGADDMRIDGNGALIIGTTVGEITEAAPVANYSDGSREPIPCRYVLSGHTLGFAFDGPVDPSRPIVIDPMVLAATYSGTGDIGITENYGGSATYGADGSIFTGAHCFSQGYPTTVGAFEISFPGGPYSMAISKLSSDGSTLLWATYLGGNGNDTPASLIEAADGSLVIMGTSNSEDYPCSSTAFDDTWGGGLIERDIVLTKLSNDGSALLASTYVGGSDDDGWNGVQWNIGDHVVGEVIVDEWGDIFVCNNTWSPDFPTTPGAVQTASAGGQDGVIFKMDAELSTMLWSTRVGSQANDVAYGIHLDGAGGVYVVGSAGESITSFLANGYQATPAGQQDGFVVHVVNAGSTIAASTYMGGPDLDQLQRIDLGPDGTVYVLGQQASPVSAEPAGVFSTGTTGVAVARFSPDLLVRDISTIVASGFTPSAFLVDACGRVYVSGYEPAVDIPTSANALQDEPSGYYIGVYEHGLGALLFGTYFGLYGDHQDAGMSRFAPDGVLYQALCEDGFPGTYPTTQGAWSTTPAESFDVVAFKMDPEQNMANEVLAEITMEGGVLCAPAELSFTSSGVGSSWTWHMGDGTAPVSGESLLHIFESPGMYDVSLVVTSNAPCVVSDSATVTVVIPECDTAVPPRIVVPNVFTPNGDPWNDLFHIAGIEGVENEVRIYNRWGQVVMQETNYRNTWDGAGVSDGTYYYVIDLPTTDTTFRGHLTILAGR